MSELPEVPRPGEAWARGPKPTPGVTWTQVPVNGTFRSAALALRALLLLTVLLTVARILLDLWGISAAGDGDPAFTADFDDRDRLLDLLTVVTFVLTGVVWLWWQYLLARSASPKELTRSPAWHVFAWIVPVLNLWWPYQNVRDLWWRRKGGWGAATVGWWWAAWLAALTVDGMVRAASDNVDSVRDFQDLLLLESVSAFAGLIAGFLALAIVGRVSSED